MKDNKNLNNNINTNNNNIQSGINDNNNYNTYGNEKKNQTLESDDEFDDIENPSPYIPNIERIVKTFKDKKAINPHAVNPEYLKLTEAEESKK